MTGMPEAKLAREAEICYACVAMITDYDCWHPGHDAVDVTQVVATLTANSGNARATVAGIAGRVSTQLSDPTSPRGAQDGTCPCGCNTALDGAIMTAPSARDPQMMEPLRGIAGRVL
jgi:5'-methylthioadenosine phosphorylase